MTDKPEGDWRNSFEVQPEHEGYDPAGGMEFAPGDEAQVPGLSLTYDASHISERYHIPYTVAFAILKEERERHDPVDMVKTEPLSELGQVRNTLENAEASLRQADSLENESSWTIRRAYQRADSYSHLATTQAMYILARALDSVADDLNRLRQRGDLTQHQESEDW
jgi:hypothetical protein